jgi:hypothetical protein
LAEYLGKVFNIDFSLYFLTNSAQWKSFIRYPKILEGKECFAFVSPKGYRAPRNILERLKSALGLGIYGESWGVDLTNEVKDFLDKASA